MPKTIIFTDHALERMKDMKPQIKYDQKVNILKIRLSNKESVDSDVKNNVVVDYDKNGEIVNM